VKGYPFEVVLPAGLKIEGAVLSDQIKSLDWRSRRAKEICPAPKGVVADVLAKILVLDGAA
jgi:mRNA interferase MazF